MHLQSDINAGITIDQLSIYLLLFADDAVLFSESAEGLHSSLNKLNEYCDKLNITVNVEKTKNYLSLSAFASRVKFVI